jgi:tRNA (mo5U34)-methyltransferase
MFSHQQKIYSDSSVKLILNESVESNFESFPASYTNWKMHSLQSSYQGVEILTDVFCRPGSIGEFNFLLREAVISSEDADHSIRLLAPWTYYLSISGVNNINHSTYNNDTIIYHRYRNNLITNNIISSLPEEIQILTAIDIGCNCGFFTMELADRGFSASTGVDLRTENIAQAMFARDALNVQNTSFIIGNVKDFPTDEKYDVVLNLGLMYHLSTPFEVMKKCFDITNKVCVIDSVTHKEPFSGYFVLSDRNINSPIEGDLSFEMQPTYRGLLETIYSAGFEYVFEVMTFVDSNIAQYSDGSRRCFFAYKDKSYGLAAFDKLKNSY